MHEFIIDNIWWSDANCIQQFYLLQSWCDMGYQSLQGEPIAFVQIIIFVFNSAPEIIIVSAEETYRASILCNSSSHHNTV